MNSKTTKDFSTVYRTWVEIDVNSIEHNYKTFRSLVGDNVKFAAIVKSNAYGHDIVQFSKKLVSLGVDILGVDSIVEALVLRKEGITTPIFVLGYILPSHVKDAVEKNIQITVSSFEMLKEIQRQKFNKKLFVHIKLDTGMHRQGFQNGDEEMLFKQLERMKGVIEIEGIYTHFAVAKKLDDSDETKKQIKKFNEWSEEFKKRGYLPTKHTCATSGAILYPEARFDMVRIGIGMCGLWPSEEIRKYCGGKMSLLPALSWKTIITEVKKIKKGERVGYDFTERLKKDSTIGICPVGYWHGYDRSLSSKAEVLVKGERCKVLGRISMDMVVIDITEVKTKVGDVVTLIGKDDKNKISAEELAEILNTINYEIVTKINPRVKRIFN